ncbi:MAG TPA: nitroreductase [Eubacteriaceae bacterium]|nr:nitroreductase [Eubacteriaceae bacterium]
MENRNPTYTLMPEITNRWSARSFSDQAVSDEDLYAVIEAASYAPSCFNEQPWRFIIARERDEKNKICNLLYEGNQKWACKAPVLVVVFAKGKFKKNQKDNYWHMFDTGTAWGYLTLEAERRNLITHAMGGFRRKKTKEFFSLSEDDTVVTIFAMGYLGEKEALPEDLQEDERPSPRKPIEELIYPFNHTKHIIEKNGGYHL